MMALCRIAAVQGGEARWGWLSGGRVVSLRDEDVIRVLTDPPPAGLRSLAPLDVPSGAVSPCNVMPPLAAPILAGQEVWAAGVTYESSKFARMSESENAGDLYAKVYTADRPELFFKATASRVVGDGGSVRIRDDSRWNVPEPELTALVSATGVVLGYTIGNDMSSRDIEGENALYLPQAKIYRRCCGLGPVIVPAGDVNPRDLSIRLTISRDGRTAFEAESNTSRMKRTVEDIAQWLFRENDFPHGVFLLTGTGIIPPETFTLAHGDLIAINVSGLGTLHNTVG